MVNNYYNGYVKALLSFFHIIYSNVIIDRTLAQNTNYGKII